MRNIIANVSNYLKTNGVYTGDAKQAFIDSGSMDQAKIALHFTINHISGGTWMSGSLTKFNGSSMLRAAFPELMNMNTGIYNSARLEGSTVLHEDPNSGSGCFTSGSYYKIGSGRGQTVKQNFDMICEAVENKMQERIATKEGKPLIAAAASGSYNTVINSIKSV